MIVICFSIESREEIQNHDKRTKAIIMMHVLSDDLSVTLNRTPIDSMKN